ncbi:hypothetical protein DFH28DRAFT_921359 [Melampsora americana]|nr:hypothetical protein DFH28DRAFT_921359 [Melampsora americana]
MNDQDQVTTSKVTCNKDKTNEPTSEPTGGLQVIKESMSLNKTVIENQVKSTPTTPNTTSEPAIDGGDSSNCPIENPKDVNDINESTFSKIVNQPSITSENKDTPCEDNPLLISDQLAFQSAKAQESLSLAIWGLLEESSANYSTSEPDNNVPLPIAHKRHLSPLCSTGTRNVQSRVQTPNPENPAEITTDKEPLWASATLPIYFKLLAALEEARRLNCLTTPMGEELERLTLRCKKTGNAIIHNIPLPDEDNVINVLDDKDKDLHTKCSFPYELSNTTEVHLKTNVHPILTPGPSKEPLHPNKNEALLTNSVEEQKNNTSNHSDTDAVVGKREDIKIDAVLELAEETLNHIDSFEDVGTQDPPPHSKNEEGKLSCMQAQSDQNTVLEQQAKTTESAPVVNKSPNSPTLKGVSHSTVNIVQSAESAEKNGKSHSNPIINESFKPERVFQESHDKDVMVAIPKYNDSSKKSKFATPTNPTKDKDSLNRNSEKEKEAAVEVPNSLTDTEQELNKLVLPYTSHQIRKNANIIAWEALTSLLEHRQLGAPLNQVFSDLIEDAKGTGFLKVLLDSVILTGKSFLKEPPPSETEKETAGVKADDKIFPHGATPAEKRNWLANISIQELLDNANNLPEFNQPSMAQTGDPHFPYPRGPGGERASPKVL